MRNIRKRIPMKFSDDMVFFSQTRKREMPLHKTLISFEQYTRASEPQFKKSV